MGRLRPCCFCSTNLPQIPGFKPVFRYILSRQVALTGGISRTLIDAGDQPTWVGRQVSWGYASLCPRAGKPLRKQISQPCRPLRRATQNAPFPSALNIMTSQGRHSTEFCKATRSGLGRHTGRQRGHPCSTTAEPARPATSFAGACLYAPARARPYRRSGPGSSDQRLQNSGGHIGRRRSEDVHAAPARQIHYNSWRRWQRVPACVAKHDGFDEADLRRRRSVLHFSFAAPGVNQRRRYIMLASYTRHAGTRRKGLGQNLRPLVLMPAPPPVTPSESNQPILSRVIGGAPLSKPAAQKTLWLKSTTCYIMPMMRRHKTTSAVCS